jgi:hypothetical protein
VAMSTPCRTNRTLPSARQTFAPPVWNAYTPNSLLQLIAHGPFQPRRDVTGTPSEAARSAANDRALNTFPSAHPLMITLLLVG